MSRRLRCAVINSPSIILVLLAVIAFAGAASRIVCVGFMLALAFAFAAEEAVKWVERRRHREREHVHG